MDQYTRPHPERAALVTVDMQNDFVRQDAPATIPGTASVVPRIQRLLEAFRSQHQPVLHVVRLYLEDGSNVDPCRRGAVEDGAEIVQPGTPGAELVSELKPADDVSLDATALLDGRFQELGPGERIVYKPRWSAFYGTALDRFLKDRSITTVVVCGCNFPNCPRTTIYDASQRDYRIVFVPDATSGTYERGLDELEAIGVSLMPSDVAAEWITSSGPPAASD